MRPVPRRIGAGLAVVIAIAAVIVIVLIVDSPSSSPASNGSQSAGATTVQRRNLVATDTESGTLSYANSQTVYNRLSGTITWLPSVGQVIKPGGTLYRVSGDPVILMNGSTPAYRDLSAADSAGPDILELNRNLVRLGFNPDGIVTDDVWQPATTDGVEVFQESLGQEPTGVLSLGQVVFLPGDQLVSALETSVGSTGGSSGSPSNSSAANLSPVRASTEFVSLTGPTTAPKPRRKSKNTQTLAALLALLKAETEQLKAEQAQLRAEQSAGHGGSNSPKGSGGGKGSGSGSGSGSGGSSNNSDSPSSGGGSPSSGSGGGGGSASPILQTSSTKLVATVDLDASKQSEAKVGEKVTVEMPAGNTTGGTVTAVSSVAQSSSDSGNGNSGGGNGGGGNGGGGNGGGGNGGNGGNGSSTATIPVTISLSGHISGAGLDQAAVSVQFVQAEARNVLSVPVTALLAISGGNYAVQAAAAPHRLIPVTTGLFAAGFVQISGPGIYSGLQVTDSQG